MEEAKQQDQKLGQGDGSSKRNFWPVDKKLEAIAYEQKKSILISDWSETDQWLIQVLRDQRQQQRFWRRHDPLLQGHWPLALLKAEMEKSKSGQNLPATVDTDQAVEDCDINYNSDASLEFA